jgi:tyrosyl-tRNA synthetase
VTGAPADGQEATEVDSVAHRAGPGRLGDLLAELEWRGILHATTPGLPARLSSGRMISGYIGFDPSGASLHVGHLVPIFGLIRLQRFGGRPVAVVGGGTGMIGDPSGRSSERNLLDAGTLDANAASLRSQLERFLDFAPGSGAIMVNNLDWLGPLTLIDFLRDVGKHFTIPYMLAKDSVQVRLDKGLSFTEFSYMLLQAYDFAHLHRDYGVELQMGGADQWGNITAGLELIRRAGGAGEALADDQPDPAHGLAYKLLLSPSGTKFGKSETGESVWLDADRTPVFAFYQYWLRTDDRDVGTYLRWFTELPREEIEALEAETATTPEARTAQRRLAFDITARTHGEAAAREADAQSSMVFERGLVGLGLSDFVTASASLPRFLLPIDSSSTAAGTALKSHAVGSNSEARRLISQGGLYVNDQRITDPSEPLPEPLHGRYWVLRTGKKNTRIVERAD